MTFEHNLMSRVDWLESSQSIRATYKKNDILLGKILSRKIFFSQNLLLEKVDFSQSPLLLVKVVLRRTMGVVGWSGGGVDML